MGPGVSKIDWFTREVMPHAGALRRRVRSSVRSDDDADDVVAEALARAFSAEDWGGVGNGKHYLFRVARNILIDEGRRGAIASFEPIVDMEAVQPSASPEPMLAARDQLRQIERFVATLPAQSRRAFVMRRIEERTPGEVAEAMGLSISTVEKHLARAMMLLTRELAAVG
ncbi:RNA polymerase sigma factor [Sphingomonas crocodyli]|uniref:Sigma-70 family RNA polymerase sigma factor n=1 Tax=Sphingomonas crocodyli TaxID=1979270 RepID=A0A437M8F1_9SPHN|nr:sigma-70 family RNA polymerase sigma factor [Sphingomonas crocodyli]RVT93939.1 sigma-70 family RNA polymerase sigma factor [Sphingomonas crocodyli]